MRTIPLLLTLAVAGLGAAAAAPANGRAACRPRLAKVGAVLPAPVAITSGRCRYLIARSGEIRGGSVEPLPVPPGARAWWSRDGTWIEVERGHLLIGRWQRTLWSSQGRFPLSYQVGAVTLRPSELAFSYWDRRTLLYLARPGHPERLIASGEFPLGWTKTGLYTRRDQGGQLLLRSPSGALRAVLARDAFRYAYQPAAGSLYFLRSDVLVRADGAHEHPLTNLHRLGLTQRTVTLQPLGTLLALQTQRRLVILRQDGTVFAATDLPRAQARADGISSSLTPSLDRRVVAFAATSGNSAYGSTGSETVYLLPAGARRATALHTSRLDFAVCERAASLAWHGHWLLYSASEGELVLLDTTRRHAAVDLSRPLHRLARSDDNGNLDFDARWG